ncbi:MAG: cbb3-type cytochrome oxidase assembly protein CcoS [Rickettsiales bacterium]|nr:cbb3-type cytochrome oxidase assembly protein CcoS [Rickettsiales bacterium]
MSVLLFLIPITLALGLVGLAAFLWNLRNKQYEDLDGAANRILFDEDRPHRPSEDQQKSVPQKDKKNN